MISREMKQQMRKKRKRRRNRRVMVLALLLVLIPTGVFATAFILKATEVSEKIHFDLGRDGSSKRDQPVEAKAQEPMSFLLLGVDNREGENDSGRSDSMIVVTVNPKLKSTKMLSIPRDLRVQVPGDSEYSKINSAYSKGGPKLAIQTVEEIFNIPIDHFVQVNFEGFVEIVDALGGIDVNNKFKFTDNGYTFEEGPLHLSGAEALTYVRMRHEDPLGDYGRQERQKEVVAQIIEQGTSFKSLTNFSEIFDALGDNVKTDLTVSEMWDIKNNYTEAAGNIESMSVEATSEKIDGEWFELISDEEQIRISNNLRTHLELPAEDTTDTSITDDPVEDISSSEDEE